MSSRDPKLGTKLRIHIFVRNPTKDLRIALVRSPFSQVILPDETYVCDSASSITQSSLNCERAVPA